MTQHEWTPERVEKLKELWGSGMSCSQVAAAMGITRSGVIGKVHRLKLPPRATSFTRSRTKPQKAPASAPQTRPAIVKETSGPVTFIGPIGDFPPLETCRYPTGDTSGKDYQMCGQPVYAVGKSWCSFHLNIVYAPQQNRQSPAPDKAEAA